MHERDASAADELPARKAAALEYLRAVQPHIKRDEKGQVIAISVACTFGLWDLPDAHDKSKWLPDFAKHLRAFPALREVNIAEWVYEDDDLRHLASIPQLTHLSNDSLYSNPAPFTGAGLRHLVMPASLRRLSLHREGIDDDSLRHVARLRGLRELSISSDNVTDEGLRCLQPLDLRELYLQSSITGNGLVHLANMRRMQKLSLNRSQINDGHLVHLAHMRELQTLNLKMNQIRGDGVVHLANMHELSELDLRFNKITDEALEHLGKLTKLRKLDLGRNQILGPGVRHLSKLKRLETVLLGYNEKLGDSALTPLLDLPALRFVGVHPTSVSIDALRRFRDRRPDVTLSFRANRAYGLSDKWSLTLNDDWEIRSVSFRDNTTDEDLAQFARKAALDGVESISLPYPQDITGKGLVHLQSHKNLKSIHLDECRIGDEGLKSIGHLLQLERLEIDEGGITGDGLAHLAGLTELRHLVLTNNGLEDDDLVHLAGLTKLTFLNLGKNNISEAGVAKHLSAAKQLRTLNLSQNLFRGDRILKGKEVTQLLNGSKPTP